MTSERVAKGIFRRRKRLMVAWRHDGRLERKLLPLGTTLTEAKDYRKARLGEIASGQLAAVIPGRCTFETVVGLLKAEHELKRRAKPLNLVRLTAAFAGWKAKEIDAAALERYVADQRAAGAADATIHNALALLRHGLRLACKRGLIGRVPDVPMREVSNTVQCFFTVPELDRLLALLPKSLRPAVEFAASSCRCGRASTTCATPSRSTCPMPGSPTPRSSSSAGGGRARCSTGIGSRAPRRSGQR